MVDGDCVPVGRNLLNDSACGVGLGGLVADIWRGGNGVANSHKQQKRAREVQGSHGFVIVIEFTKSLFVSG